MTLTQIARKYNISEAFLNAKDDALLIAAASLRDLKGMLDNNAPKADIGGKLNFLADFLTDIKNSTH